MYLSGIGAFILATGSFVSAATTSTATSSSSGILAVESPTWLPNAVKVTGVNAGYPTGPLDVTATLSRETLDFTSTYPKAWESPPTNSSAVQAVIKAIDWTKVPNAPIRKAGTNGDIVMTGYDISQDPYCWWSATNCVKPKASYLPTDIYYCPNANDWGLNYDDGPYNPSDSDAELNEYAEPYLYNFLAKQDNQKASLFYIGSNVATYPAAARRALNDGHVLCAHTWSHPQMTTQSNDKVVAELYWTLRAIKEATGITTKCWRPPYGDVDDRVRAIAHQMGLQTIIWNADTNDWAMPGDGGGTTPASTVDGYFTKWISDHKAGKDKVGLITLEHELNNATVKMTEKWLPALQTTFNVVSIHQCMNISQPYWETNWVYPTEANPTVAGVNNSSTSKTTAASVTHITSAVAATSATSLAVKNQLTNSATSVNVQHGSALVISAVAIAAYFF